MICILNPGCSGSIQADIVPLNPRSHGRRILHINPVPAVAGNQVARSCDRTANQVARGLHPDAVTSVAQRCSTRPICSDVVALNHIASCGSTYDLNPSRVISADDISGSNRCASDQGINRSISELDSITAIAPVQSTCDIRADIVPGDDVARGSSRYDPDPVAHVACDDIAFGSIRNSIGIRAHPIGACRLKKDAVTTVSDHRRAVVTNSNIVPGNHIVIGTILDLNPV